jgi:hypothetical protein
MTFRYSQLCGTASDAADAVDPAKIGKGFKFKNINQDSSLKKVI